MLPFWCLRDQACSDACLFEGQRVVPNAAAMQQPIDGTRRLLVKVGVVQSCLQSTLVAVLLRLGARSVWATIGQ